MARFKRLRRSLPFRLRVLLAALTIKPVRGGSPDDPADPGKTDPDPKDPKVDPKDPADPKDPDPDPITPEDDWQTKARKHERDAKKERGAREKLERRLQELEDAGKNDHQKAIDDAVKAAKEEAAAERRHDRLEVEITRLAAKGVKAGDDDGVKFADTEDALLRIRRRIEDGDLDADEIFDDKGKVKTKALESALGKILEEAPHLIAGSAGSESGSKNKPSGSSDAGKGRAAEGQLKSTEGMSPEEIAKAALEGRLDDYLKSNN